MNKKIYQKLENIFEEQELNNIINYFEEILSNPDYTYIVFNSKPLYYIYELIKPTLKIYDENRIYASLMDVLIVLSNNYQLDEFSKVAIINDDLINMEDINKITEKLNYVGVNNKEIAINYLNDCVNVFEVDLEKIDSKILIKNNYHYKNLYFRDKLNKLIKHNEFPYENQTVSNIFVFDNIHDLEIFEENFFTYLKINHKYHEKTDNIKYNCNKQLINVDFNNLISENTSYLEAILDTLMVRSYLIYTKKGLEITITPKVILGSIDTYNQDAFHNIMDLLTKNYQLANFTTIESYEYNPIINEQMQLLEITLNNLLGVVIEQAYLENYENYEYPNAEVLVHKPSKMSQIISLNDIEIIEERINNPEFSLDELYDSYELINYDQSINRLISDEFENEEIYSSIIVPNELKDYNINNLKKFIRNLININVCFNNMKSIDIEFLAKFIYNYFEDDIKKYDNQCKMPIRHKEELIIKYIYNIIYNYLFYLEENGIINHEYLTNGTVIEHKVLTNDKHNQYINNNYLKVLYDLYLLRSEWNQDVIKNNLNYQDKLYIEQYFELLDSNLFNEDELKSLKENYERLIDQYIVYYDELYKIEHNISSMGISLDINGLLESFVGKPELSKILKK